MTVFSAFSRFRPCTVGDNFMFVRNSNGGDDDDDDVIVQVETMSDRCAAMMTMIM